MEENKLNNCCCSSTVNADKSCNCTECNCECNCDGNCSCNCCGGTDSTCC